MNDSQTDTGYLAVKVTTASEGIPVENAIVYIKDYPDEGTSDVLYSLRTNVDGATRKVELQAPPKADSLRPGSPALPYSQYIISVQKDGFNSVENIGVPIFSGITSIQSVNMIPLTEDQLLNGETGEFSFFENDGYPSLRSNGDN